MKKQWWHDKVAYQIYPKSFYDSNGDGIGDLPGIIAKLDYLKGLGVDILWLSPIYRSPLADQGYDISDYYDIDPRFGTMEDMDRLLAEAKKRDMYVVMDLVVNHCSDEHAWFKKACEDPEGEFGQYFYLRKLEKAGASGDRYAACSPDGYVLPCNWRSYFGGSVWEKLPGHEDWFYLHVFHKKQPDLNWENPKVREEIYRMVNWWLDRGLAGFRIDAIINIKKALPFRSYAPDRADGLCAIDRMLQEASGVGTFLGELRDRTFAPHGAFTVGEVFNERDEELPDFIGDGGYFSTMFDFTGHVWGSAPEGWHANAPITPDAYRDCLFTAQKRVGGIGLLSNIVENHDEPRGVSRYIPEEDWPCPAAKKALATVYFFLKGLPWIYQGQEIGMENVPLGDISEVDDIASLDAWKVMRGLGVPEADALKAIERNGRDNARTPFQWSAGHAAGFTAGTPWLRVNPNYTRINLAQQEGDPDSVFSHYRKMISLRKDPQYRGTFVYGDFVPYLPDMHNVIAYLRRTDAKTVLVLSNYQREARTLPLPAPVRRVLLDNYDCTERGCENCGTLQDKCPGQGHADRDRHPGSSAMSGHSNRDMYKGNCAEPGSADCRSDAGEIALAGYQTLVLELFPTGE